MTTTTDRDSYLEAYKSFANILRTWLVAYGIGAPVLVLSQQSIWSALKETDGIKFTASLFLAGVLTQVLFSLMYKWAMWEIYMGEIDTERKGKCRYKAAHWLSEQYFIDILADFGAIIMFAIATLRTFNDLMS